ncbi:FitA-like ribbon-helix-helix domain-containing protein [Actinomyces stomatis]|uniref:FitA-like ribbon-helix-helix domain-containing protein n=1 Tax=Actinomyces stomatis TaxID=3050227 RepID=UPI003D174ECD
MVEDGARPGRRAHGHLARGRADLVERHRGLVSRAAEGRPRSISATSFSANEIQVEAVSSAVVRNLPETTHQDLKACTQLHGRSTEAEIRHILGNAAAQDHKPRLGSLLTSIRDEIVGVDLAPARDRSPDNPIDLS